MIKAAEVRLAVYTSISAREGALSERGDGKSELGDYPMWISAGRYVVGIGKPVSRSFPVIAYPRSQANDPPGQQAVLRIGMAYVSQALTEQVYSRPVWPDGLVETTLQMLSIGFFVVTAQGEIRHDGRTETSEEKSGWLVLNNRLSLRAEKERIALQEAMREAAAEPRRSSIVSVSVGFGQVRLAAVAPLGPLEQGLALVLFENNRTDHHALRTHFFRAYGLTRSESLIAHEVLNGKAPADTAESTGLSIATVRSYLKHILAKTGTHRQSELVALYYSSILPVGASIARAETRRQ